MKSILIINDEVLFPPFKNGCVSTLYNFSKVLIERGIQVSLKYLNLRDSNAEKQLFAEGFRDIESLEACGHEIQASIDGKSYFKPRGSWKFQFNRINGVDASEFDYVVVGNLNAGPIISKIFGDSKLIFFEADSASLYYERAAGISSNLLKKLYYRLQRKIARRLEGVIYPKVLKTVFVSEVDFQYTLDHFDGNNFCTAEIGVNLPATTKGHFGSTGKKINICFSGILNYGPNAIAVDYILDKILPELDRQNIGYTFHIVGKNPLSKWEEIAGKNPNIVVTGYLDDINAYLAQMDVYLSPLFLGTGMKNKVLQAMAIGLPMICSTISTEGILELKDGENCFICDNEPSKWVEKIVELSTSKMLQKKFSESCRKIIAGKYTWERFTDILLE